MGATTNVQKLRVILLFRDHLAVCETRRAHSHAVKRQVFDVIPFQWMWTSLSRFFLWREVVDFYSVTNRIWLKSSPIVERDNTDKRKHTFSLRLHAWRGVKYIVAPRAACHAIRPWQHHAAQWTRMIHAHMGSRPAASSVR